MAMKLNRQDELCSLCCNDIPPWRAVKLGCDHGWYCAQCVLRHTEARLAIGATSIECPECSQPLAERDLRKMLPADVMERLLTRSLEQAVSSAADLWSCPTPNCPMRVALEPGEIPRLKCTECKKSSCLWCGAQPYHTNLTCEEHADKLKALVAKGAQKSAAQTAAALRLQKEAEAEADLKRWLEETGTKQCPTCHMAISKNNIEKQKTQYAECHKMMCRNCNTRFCFKCEKVLTEEFTCGCSIDAHGFVDPATGKRLDHFKPLPLKRTREQPPATKRKK